MVADPDGKAGLRPKVDLVVMARSALLRRTR
jgi:hypothetical protein